MKGCLKGAARHKFSPAFCPIWPQLHRRHWQISPLIDRVVGADMPAVPLPIPERRYIHSETDPET